MFDVAMLALVVICFALAMGYANLCDHVLARPTGEDIAP